MSSVDERVVKIKLDNSNFESNANKTNKTLDKLVEKLKLKNGAKGFNDIEKAAKGVSLDSLARSVENIEKRFSTLGIVGTTALVNITNSAMTAGQKIVSALTIDGAKLGFQEYETQMNAIQTILANTKSKGSTLDDVNKALEELNHYADMTIYNFTEMTSNIGRFTAAGVGLETSVSAIKGISNLAGVVGANSEQSARAMYQLSQAISLGALKLEDWNSVQEAGLGGEIFQESLKETARVHGVEVDKIIAKEGSFRESLKKGWITTEVLTETLAKFTGDLSDEQLKQMGYTDEQIVKIQDMAQTALDATTKVKTFTQLFDTLGETAQSGWTQTWQILIGDFEEAKSMLTALSDYFGELINQMSDARNRLLQGWVDLGGREKVLQGIKNIWDGILSVIKPIGEAFRDVFPALESIDLWRLSDGFLKFTEKMKISAETADKLKRIFKGVFAIFDIGIRAVKAIAGGFFDLVGAFTPFRGGMLDILAVLGDWIRELDRSIKWSGFFETAVDAIVDVLSNAVSWWGQWVKKFGEGFSTLETPDFSFFNTLSDGITINLEKLKAVASNFFEQFSQAFERGFDSFQERMQALFDKLLNRFGQFMEWFSARLPQFGNALKTSLSVSIVATLLNFINKLASVPGGLGNIFNSIGDTIEKSQELVKPIKKVLGALKDAIGSFGDMLEDFGKAAKMKQILSIGIAVGIVAAAVWALAKLPAEQAFQGCVIVASMFVLLMGSFTILDKLVVDSTVEKLTKLSVSLMAFGASMLLIAGSLRLLSGIDLPGLAKGVGTVLVTLATLTKLLDGFSMTGGGSAAAAILALAVAMNMLVLPIFLLGKIDILTLTKGVGSLAVTLIAFCGSLSLLNGVELKASVSLGIITLATAMILLSTAVERLGSMKLWEIIKGLVSLGVALKILSKSLGSLTQNLDLKQAGTLLVIASMLNILAKAVQTLGSIPFLGIIKSLVSLTVVLAELTYVTNTLSTPVAKVGAANLKSLAKSLIALSVPLLILSRMSFSQLAVGLLAIGGALAEIGLFTKAMSGQVWNLQALSTGLLSFGAACTVLSASFLLLSNLSFAQVGTALLALGGALAIFTAAAYALAPVAPILSSIAIPLVLLGTAATAFGAALWLVSEAMVNFSQMTVVSLSDITAQLPLVSEFLSTLVSSFLNAIGNILSTILGAIPEIIAAGMQFVASLLEGINANLPRLIDAGANFVLYILNGLAPRIGEIVTAGADLLIKFLNGLNSKMPELVTAGMNTLINFLNGVQTYVPQLAQQGVQFVVGIIEGIGQTLDLIVQSAFDLTIKFINALADGFRTNTGPLLTAVGDLGTAIIDGLFNALKAGAGKVIDFVKGIGEQALAKFEKVLGIASPSKRFREAGQYITDGLVAGLMDGLGKVEVVSGKVAETTIEPTKKAAKKALKEVAKVTEEIIPAFVNSCSEAGRSAKKFWEKYNQDTKGEIGTAIILVDDVIVEYKELQDHVEDAADAVTDDVTEAADAMADSSEAMTDAAEETTGSVEELGEKTEETAEKIEESAEGIKDTTYEFSEFADVMTFAGDVVQHFQDRFGEAFKSLGETAPLEAGQAAVNELASATYYAAEAAKKSTDEMAEKTEETVDRMKEVQESFLELRKNLADNIKGQMSIFDEFDTKTELTAQDLLKNMQSQVDGVSKWADNLEILAERGIDQGLLRHLAEMGPKGYEQVNAFTNMTLDEIQRANQLFGQYLQLPEDVTTRILSSYAYTGLMAAQGFANGMTPEAAIGPATSMGQTALNALQDTLQEHSPSRATYLMGQNLVIGLNNGVSESIDTVKPFITQLGTYILAAFQTEFAADKMTAVGQQMIQGIVMGIIQATTTITTSFQAAGLAGMDALNSAYTSKQGVLVATINMIIEACRAKIQSYTGRYQEAGRQILSSLITGFKNREREAKTTMQAIITGCLNEITKKNGQFTTAGRNVITSLINGFKARMQAAVTLIRQIMVACIQQIKATEESWKTSGENVVNGFIRGIKAKQREAERAARAMARAAAEAAREEFDEHSPSKVFEKIGRFAAEGLAIGLTGYTYYVENAGKDLGEMAEEAAKDGLGAIEDLPSDLDDIDDVVITPIIDSSELDKDIDEVNDKINNNLIPIGTDGKKLLLLQSIGANEIKRLEGISFEVNKKALLSSANLKELSSINKDDAGNIKKVEFVQNNYSPKSLSSVEIYRNTKNLLSLTKGNNTIISSGMTARKVQALAT